MKTLRFEACTDLETCTRYRSHLKYLIGSEKYTEITIPGMDGTISMSVPVVTANQRNHQEKVCLLEGSAKLYSKENNLYIQNDEPVIINYNNNLSLLLPGTWNISVTRSIDHFA